MSRLACSLLLLALGAASSALCATLEVQVRDPGGHPLRDVAVYVMPPTGPAETKGARASIEQADREFVPYLSIVQTGTSVAFPNRDPILHHVYSFSPAKQFEIKLYTGKSPREEVFDKPGPVTLGCNIHDWMIGYVLVVSTPHFGKTDEAGVVRLRDLPAGAYEVHTYHPQQRAAAAPQKASLEAASNGRAAFVLDVAPRKAKYKPPLERLKY